MAKKVKMDKHGQEHIMPDANSCFSSHDSDGMTHEESSSSSNEDTSDSEVDSNISKQGGSEKE